MNEISTKFLVWREAIRGLWNQYLREAANSTNAPSEVYRKFHQIEALLFQTLIAHPLGIFRDLEDENDYSSFEFSVELEAGHSYPLLVQRSNTESGYWDNKTTNTGGGKMTGTFVGFFDWDESTYIDLRYVKAHISHFEGHDELVGLDVLVEVRFCRFYWAGPNEIV